MARAVTFSPLWDGQPEPAAQFASPGSVVDAPVFATHRPAAADAIAAQAPGPSSLARAFDPRSLAAAPSIMFPLSASPVPGSAPLEITLPVAGLLASPDARADQPGVPAAAPMLAAVPAAPARATGSRWSADGWLLLRREGTTPIVAGQPSYGRSQAGAVIRYRLAPASALRPQLYLRVSTALAGAREHQAAAGVSARLVPGLPLRFAAEARADETAAGTRVRPAAFVVTELPPLRLPLGGRAEAYAQAGYVGGDYATAFVDGQARVERPLVWAGRTEISAGAGAWGGAQKGAARLDVGPGAAVSFPLGPARGRLAADYRFRVAGDAEPASGPALTLSAGF